MCWLKWSGRLEILPRPKPDQIDRGGGLLRFKVKDCLCRRCTPVAPKQKLPSEAAHPL